MLIANSDDTAELIKLAVIRSNRFHAPKSHKDAAKVELSSEEIVSTSTRRRQDEPTRRYDPEYGEALEGEGREEHCDVDGWHREESRCG